MGLVHSAATYMAFLGTRMALGTEDKTQLGTLIESPLLSGSYYSGNGPFGVQTFQEMIRCKIDPPPLPKRHHFSRGGSSEKAVGGGGGDIVHHIWTRVMLTLPQRKSMHPAMRGHKFPVVVIAPGFLLKATQYQTYAKKLASFGYVVVCYDIPSETIGRTLDDVNHYRLIPQILNFIEKNNQGFSGSFRRKITPFHTSCNTNDDTARGGGECLDSGRRKVVVPKPNHVDAAIMPLGPELEDDEISPFTSEFGLPSPRPALTFETSKDLNLADTSRVMLAGHSRGGKLAVLASEEDHRVKSLFLIDPVDNTIYAPVSERFPSAVASLKRRKGIQLPVAVVGAGRGHDCAPKNSNFEEFFHAAPGDRMQVVMPAAGHFEFLSDLTDLEVKMGSKRESCDDDDYDANAWRTKQREIGT
eukprot:jgi/Bigna1/127605/aug1.4_g2313